MSTEYPMGTGHATDVVPQVTSLPPQPAIRPPVDPKKAALAEAVERAKVGLMQLEGLDLGLKLVAAAMANTADQRREQLLHAKLLADRLAERITEALK